MNPAIHIYDSIGDFGIKPVLPEEIAAQLKTFEQAGHKAVDVFVNSPGGEVFAGITLHNLLMRSTLDVIMHVDGLAASAASLVLMAGDKIIAAPSSIVMIHSAWTVAAGNADQFEQAAREMRTVDQSIAGIYAARTGQSLEKIREMLAAETWLGAEDAKALGFVDEIAAAEETPAPAERKTNNKARETLAWMESRLVVPGRRAQ
jgi:ATP-dependent Clp protease protease subunit